VKAAGNCPTDIRVAEVGQGNHRDFGKDSRITGWGGYAVMEVSDPSGKSWDGTAIHENLTNVKNTCGDDGKSACSNQSRDDRAGGGGSTFEVGKKSNFMGIAPLAAAKNRFYDLHVFAKKGSLLHELKKDTCEIQCEQFYDCGGKRFGPTFVITYTMTKDLVPRADGLSNAVTRVRVSKAAKAASGNAAP